jgi:hypothetical protein
MDLKIESTLDFKVLIVRYFATMSAADLIERLDIHSVSALGDHDRRRVLQACDRLKAELETPMDTTARLVFSVCRVESDGSDRTDVHRLTKPWQ